MRRREVHVTPTVFALSAIFSQVAGGARADEPAPDQPDRPIFVVFWLFFVVFKHLLAILCYIMVADSRIP